MVTRRTDGIVKLVDKLILATFTSLPLSPKPSSACSALINLVYRRAMEEYATLVTNNTWDSIPHPPSSNVVMSKWVFKHKFHVEGSLECYKARWVCWGFT
jgi:hypothetical protein